MSLVFEEILDLYQRKIQKDSKVVYKKKWFIQKFLYIFDEQYYLMTECARLLAEKSNVYKEIHEFYPELSNKWCKSFYNLYREVKMSEIIEYYYSPIIYKNSTQKTELRSLLGDKHNKAYTVIPTQQLYPKIFINYMIDNSLSSNGFFFNSNGIIEPPLTHEISDTIKECMKSQSISPHVSLMLTNLRKIPKSLPLDLPFITLLSNRYEPEYKHFLRSYITTYEDKIKESDDVIANILRHIIVNNGDKFDVLNYIKIFKEWHARYEANNGLWIRRNICKGDYLLMLSEQ